MEQNCSKKIKSKRKTRRRFLFAVLILLSAAVFMFIVLPNKQHRLSNTDGSNSVADAGCEYTADIIETASPMSSNYPKTIPQPMLTYEPYVLPTAEPARAGVLINGPVRNEDVTFLSRGVQVTATVCMPESVTPCPVVVMAHGYGGEKHAHGGFTHIANALYDNGVASIRFDFSGCGDSSEPSTAYCLTEMMLDLKNAGEYMINNFYVDATKLGLIGYSLGGRAVLEALAVSMVKPNAVMLIAPAASTTDFIRLIGGENVWQTKMAEAMEKGKTNLAGMNLGYAFFSEMDACESPTEVAAASYNGKTIVVYSDDDQAVSPIVSFSVADALNSQTLVLNGAGHICGLQGDPENQHLSLIIALAVVFFR